MTTDGATPETIAVLAGAAARGDTDALQELCRLRNRAMLAFALSRHGDRELARESVAEAWVRITRYISTFTPHPGASWDSWAFTILRNVISTNAKKEARIAARRAPEEAAASIPCQTSGPDDSVIAVEQKLWAHKTVRELLPEMRDDWREVVRLRVFADLSVKETAEVLGISCTSVTSRMNRAVNFMRDRLGGSVSEDEGFPSTRRTHAGL